MSLFNELKRRNVIRVASAYLVVSWLAIQLAEMLFPVYGLSDAAIRIVVGSLVLGFIPVVVLSWTFQFTSEGLVRDEDVDPTSPALHASTRRLDRFLIASLLLATAYFALDKFVLDPSRDAARQESAKQSGRLDALAELSAHEAGQRLPYSVAILPFDNFSPDPEDAYFADGIHEAVINDLAKVRAMNVIARSTVARFTGTALNLREIAESLNVGSVLEGTVRYAGDKVRIGVQLVNPETQLSLWAEQYDRDLADVFAIQSDIARRIAQALEARLLPGEREELDTVATSSGEASAAFFKAMRGVRGGFRVAASPSTRESIQAYLDLALEADPDFALAHAWKARVYVASRLYDPVAPDDWPAFRDEVEGLVELHAARALELDPNMGLAYSALADLYAHNWRSEDAEVAAEEALRLTPNDPEVLVRQAGFDIHRERFEDAIRHLTHARELDPSSGRVLHELGYALHASGQDEAACQVLERALELNPRDALCAVMLARARFALGDRKGALESLELTQRLLPSDAAPGIRGEIAWGFGLLGRPREAKRALDRVMEIATRRYVDPAVLAWAYLGVGDEEMAARQLQLAAEDLSRVQDSYPAHFIRENSWSDPVLEQERFLQLRERLALP